MEPALVWLRSCCRRCRHLPTNAHLLNVSCLLHIISIDYEAFLPWNDGLVEVGRAVQQLQTLACLHEPCSCSRITSGADNCRCCSRRRSLNCGKFANSHLAPRVEEPRLLQSTGDSTTTLCRGLSLLRRVNLELSVSERYPIFIILRLLGSRRFVRLRS